MPQKSGSVVVFVAAGVLAGAADHNAVGLDRDRDRAMAGPVLRVGGIVLHGRVEPEPVSLLAVVERSLERLRPAAPAATAATPAATAARPVVAVAVAIVIVALHGLVLVVVGLLLRLALGLEGLR